MFRYSAILLLSVILFLQGFFPIPNNSWNFSNDPPAHVGNISINVGEVYQRHFKKTVLIVIDALRWDFATPELMPLTMGHMNRKGCITKVSVESPTVTLPRLKALTTGSVPQYIDMIKNLASSEILADSWLHSARDKGLKTVFYGDNTWEKLFPDFFTRSEGTTSFFVWDFTEVDDNVTRNVNVELEQTDWDIMILHYLGLDHIGHVLGPFSNKMPPKLGEMDGIIHTIYERTNYTDTLILVTGDHGMRDAGGHGGTSHPEVTVPLIAIGHTCQNSSFLQTDFPVNLAVILGLNIPTTSIGKIQKEFLGSLSLAEYLYVLRYNTEILLKKNNLCNNNFDNATYFHGKFLQSYNISYADKARHLYEECSEKITKELYEASNKQDMNILFLVLLLLFNVLILLILNVGAQRVFHLEIFFYICVLLIQFFVVLPKILNIILGIMALIKLKTLLQSVKMWVRYSHMHIFLMVACVVHPITFISTSFIEEEHYFWIFFSVTVIVLLLIQDLSQEEIKSSMLPSASSFLCKIKLFDTTDFILNLNSLKLLMVLVLIRFSMDLNSTLENSVQNDDNWANIFMAEENHVYHQIFFVFGLILVYFTLYCGQNSFILNISSFLVLILIFLLKCMAYHNTFLGKLIWGTIFLQKMLFKGFSWRQFWILSSTLLMKPHNVILIPFAVYTGNCLIDSNQFHNIPSITIITYMLSNCFYFLQGHRNSLASVDISIGYTGLNDYYPFLVISQVLIHTYAFPVLFHLTLLRHISESSQQLFWKTLLSLRTSVVLATGIVMIIFRHHLFIWSVFAPKLFIESVHTGFLFIEICLWYSYNCAKKLLSL